MRSLGEGGLESLQRKTNRIFKSSKKHKGSRFKVIKIMGVDRNRDTRARCQLMATRPGRRGPATGRRDIFEIIIIKKQIRAKSGGGGRLRYATEREWARCSGPALISLSAETQTSLRMVSRRAATLAVPGARCGAVSSRELSAENQERAATPRRVRSLIATLILATVTNAP